MTHGAAREDFQNGIMPLVTTYQCDAITGDANKLANTCSRLKWVYNSECIDQLHHADIPRHMEHDKGDAYLRKNGLRHGYLLHSEGNCSSPSLYSI